MNFIKIFVVIGALISGTHTAFPASSSSRLTKQPFQRYLVTTTLAQHGLKFAAPLNIIEQYAQDTGYIQPTRLLYTGPRTRAECFTFETDLNFCWSRIPDRLRSTYGMQWLAPEVAKRWILQAVRARDAQALDRIRFLCSRRGATVHLNFEDREYGESMLSLAVRWGRKKIARSCVLINKLFELGGANLIDEPNSCDNKTPLQIAHECSEKDTRIIDLLASHRPTNSNIEYVMVHDRIIMRITLQKPVRSA